MIESRSLESEAFLYPPMEPFMAPGGDPAALMRSVLLKCEELSGRIISHYDSLEGWLSRIVKRGDVAFYGGALADAADAKDIDLLSFPSESAPLGFRKPDFIHVYEPFDARVCGFAPIFLAGPLLFPDMPDISVLRRIEAERKVLSEAPFFNGGLGELITHAAYKAAESGEAAKTGGFPAGFCFRLQRKWFDGANMQMVAHTPHELNGQIREQMRELKDPQVHALAMAAIRRLRAKKEARAALADRFLKELRAG